MLFDLGLISLVNLLFTDNCIILMQIQCSLPILSYKTLLIIFSGSYRILYVNKFFFKRQKGVLGYYIF